MKAKDLQQTLGTPTMMNLLGVKQGAISAAVVRGSFPTSWYMILKEHCDKEGVRLDEGLFNWKAPSKTVPVITVG